MQNALNKSTNYFRYVLIALPILAIAILTGSCKKILEQKPKNSTYDQVFWQNVRDCESAIAGNYALLRKALTDMSAYEPNAFKYFMYGDAETSANTYFTINYSGDGLEGIQGGDFTFQYNLQTLGDWTSFYKVIAMSNLILKKIPTIEDSKLEKDVSDVAEYKNKIMGQALFIRAYTYFMLTKVYGDVPLVTVSYDDVLTAPQLPRSDKQEVMKQIEDDCHAAINMLSWGYEVPGERAVTANKGSVYALLAHLYLWRATTSNVNTDDPIASDVNSADTTLKRLIAEGGYQLQDTANYGAQFIGQSTESIFEIAMSENNLEGAWGHIGLGFLTGKYVQGYGTTPRFWVPENYISTHYKGVVEGTGSGWVYYPGGWNWYDDLIIKGDRYYLMENGNLVDVTDLSDNQGGYAYVWHDDLGDYVYEMVGFGADPFDIRFKNNFDFGGSQGRVCIKYRNINYRNPGRKSDPYMSNNIILFRLSDMILLQAEVALYQDKLGDAADIINKFRLRNHSSSAELTAGDGKSAIMYQYMIERGRELYLEGQLYWDLIRTRMYLKFIPWLSDSRFKNEGFYWPITPTLFKDNGNLTQTKYWRGRIK